MYKFWVLIVSVWFLLPAINAAGQTADDFFDDRVLHEIRIDIRPSDWQTLKDQFRENDYYSCNMRWRFQGREIGIQEIGIRSRGTGSRSPIKPGLRVDFNRYDSKRRFLGLKSFVLRNNTQDASMMHERVAMAFLRRMGIAASREAHTKLYVNDEYVGLYTIVESVDQAFLRRQFNEEDGYLYKYNYPPAQAPYYFEYRGADLSLYSPSPFQPETHETDPNPVPLEVLIRTINQESDANFENAMAQFLDLKTFMLEVGIEAFLAEQDGILGDWGLNNFYFYNFQNSNRFQIIPWDKSNTFIALDRSVWQNVETNKLMVRALEFPSLRAEFINVIVRSAASAGGPGGWLEQEVARVYNQIRSAALEDPNKLCDPEQTDSFRLCSNEEFEAAVAFMTQFARERNNIVLQELGMNTGTNEPGRRTFNISDRGGSSLVSAGASGNPTVGYARIQPHASNTTPAGIAIFGLRQNNVLVTEAAVPASPFIRSGRTYAEVNGPVNTGLAIANPNAEAAAVTFFFTDPSGRNFGQGTTTIDPGGQIAKFLNEAPFNGGSSVSGSFTFSSSAPVGVIALRGFANEQSEFLITTLPVIELSNTATEALILPHFADGGGWATQIVLVNPSDDTISGTVQFVGQGSVTAAAQPVTLTLDGRTDTSFAYTIAARSSVRLRSAGTGAAIRSGSVRIITSNRPPVALAIFSYKVDGVTVSEAGVPAIGTGGAFRMYVERTASVQSGIAIANLSNSPVTANFELTTLTGESTGLVGIEVVPANGQIAKFLDQIQGLGALPSTFQGVLRVSTASSQGISVLGLRGRYNERGHFLITTTTPVLETSAPPAAELLFPHLVDSGGYTTQFILYSGYAGQASSGVLRYFTQSGQPLDLKLQ